MDVLLDLSPEELLQRIGDYDGLIIRSATKVTAEVIDQAGNLKAIGRAGIGVDNIDIEVATKRGIIVANAPESNTVAAAEHTWGSCSRRRGASLPRTLPCGVGVEADALKGVEVSGKTIGLIGLGHVGAIVARGALGMGMRVLAYDPYVSEDKMRSMNVGRAETADEVFERADFVSLHVPRTPQTVGLVNEDALAKMKPTAYLINVARGEIVDETALYNALKEGAIAGAALDVFAEEPTTDSPIFTLSNVVVTPHLGASTAEAQDRAGITAAKQVATALRGAVPVHAINAPVSMGEGAEFVAQFSGLCEALGSLLYQLTDHTGDTLRIEYRGEVAGFDTRLLDVSPERLLAPMVFEPLNFVNTPALAKEGGSRSRPHGLRRARTTRPREYAWVRTRERTLFGPRMQPRLVEAMGFDFDVVAQKYMLFIRNEDRPGMIGKLGSILGEHGIKHRQHGCRARRARFLAAMAVTVDEPWPRSLNAP